MLYFLDSRRWDEAGFSCDQTDPFGSNIVENPVHVYYFSAILLHLLGIDHERLAFTSRVVFSTDGWNGQMVKLILAWSKAHYLNLPQCGSPAGWFYYNGDYS